VIIICFVHPTNLFSPFCCIHSFISSDDVFGTLSLVKEEEERENLRDKWTNHKIRGRKKSNKPSSRICCHTNQFELQELLVRYGC
jgi:hypothetical protein